MPGIIKGYEPMGSHSNNKECNNNNSENVVTAM